jgi:hypothetical protein
MYKFPGRVVATKSDNTEEKIVNSIYWKIPHSLGRCDVECSACGALHWLDEATAGEIGEKKKVFSMCCQKNKVTIPVADEDAPGYPIVLQSLLTVTSPSELCLEVIWKNLYLRVFRKHKFSELGPYVQQLCELHVSESKH